jgi:hypothetical protein
MFSVSHFFTLALSHPCPQGGPAHEAALGLRKVSALLRRFAPIAASLHLAYRQRRADNDRSLL